MSHGYKQIGNEKYVFPDCPKCFGTGISYENDLDFDEAVEKAVCRNLIQSLDEEGSCELVTAEERQYAFGAAA